MKDKINKKTILKIIVIVIIILLLCYITNIGRKMYIIYTIEKKNQEYSQMENIYTKKTSNLLEETITQIWYKDGIQKEINFFLDTGEIYTIYTYENMIKTFSDIDGEVQVEIFDNDTKVINTAINSFTKYESVLDLIAISMATNIKFDKDEDVYILTDYMYSVNKEDNIENLDIYIDKQTGLVNKSIILFNINQVLEEFEINYEYSFGEVMDEDIEEE